MMRYVYQNDQKATFSDEPCLEFMKVVVLTFCVSRDLRYLLSHRTLRETCNTNAAACLHPPRSTAICLSRAYGGTSHITPPPPQEPTYACA